MFKENLLHTDLSLKGPNVPWPLAYRSSSTGWDPEGNGPQNPLVCLKAGAVVYSVEGVLRLPPVPAVKTPRLTGTTASSPA